MNNSSSSPATPTESSPEKPNSAEAVVVLSDQGGTVTVNKNGTVVVVDDEWEEIGFRPTMPRSCLTLCGDKFSLARIDSSTGKINYTARPGVRNIDY